MTGIFVNGPDVRKGVGLRIALIGDGGISHVGDGGISHGVVGDIMGMQHRPNWELFIGLNPAFSLDRLQAAEDARKHKYTIKDKSKP
jgi:hypothetical protein